MVGQQETKGGGNKKPKEGATRNQRRGNKKPKEGATRNQRRGEVVQYRRGEVEGEVVGGNNRPEEG